MTTKRLFTTICTLALTLSMAWAQGPNGSETYYQAANGKKGQALKTAMYGIIKTHTNIGYDGLYEAYRATDTRPDGYVRDWYSNVTYYTHVVDKAGTYSGEGDCYNREHSVPQSWFEKYGNASKIKADIVHVLPTDGFVNNQRGNYPLAKVGTVSYQSANGYSKRGTCATPGYNGTVFEPNNEIKGDMARIYFYMATCYEEDVDDWAGNATASAVFDGTTYPAFKTWYLNMLMEWSKDDPVDAVEIARNNAVKEKQGNRNPFVDYPGLEDYIWGDKKNVAFSYDHYEGSSSGKQYVTMSFSPTSVTATLGESFTAPTLSMSPSGLTVTYSSSNTNVATVNASTGAVTLKAVGVTIITATFAGNDDYYSNSATYTLTVKQQGGDDPTPGGETLLWESFSGYKGTTDTSTGITPSDENLDYDGWASFTKVFLGANGTGKLSSGSGNGSMVTKTITLVGNGVLTFKLKKYGSDACSLSLSVSGATADVTKITPGTDWVDYVVNISDANGGITLAFNATKRLYIDDIKLVSVAEEPTTTPGDIVKDGKTDWNDLKALVKILLGITPAGDNIDSDAADVNGDDETNIADVTKLVNMILQNNQ
jgi:endonuclease I